MRLAGASFCLVFGSVALAQTPDCGRILSIVERVQQTPPYGPQIWADVHHDGVHNLKYEWRGSEHFTFQVGDSPYSIPIDKTCMFSAETLEVEAWKLGCPESQHPKQSTSISPGPPTLDISATLGPPGHGQLQIVVPWKAVHVSGFRLRALLHDGRRLLDKNNFGSVVEGVEVIDIPGGTLGTVIVEATACNGMREEAYVNLTQNDCDQNCSMDECNEMPECKGGPVHTYNRNMRYEEVDPLPVRDVLPFRRTYHSRSWEIGFFGPRWSSIFDASLSHFTDIDGSRVVSVRTEDGGLLLFSNRSGGYVQLGGGGPLRGKLVQAADGTWTQTDGSGRRQRRFDAQGRPAAFVDVTTGRELRLVWSGAGVPLTLADSWGNWTIDVTATATAPHRITTLAVQGQPELVWTYVYGNHHLARVDTPAGTWRRYEYDAPDAPERWWRLSAIRDGSGHLLESHHYTPGDAGEAVDSYGQGGEIQSISVREPGRSPAEWKATISYRNGRVEKHYRRWIAGEWRTVEVEGGCTTCGDRFAVAVYDRHGHVIRAQDPNGFITEKTYDDAGHHVLRTRTALRPSQCDPATDASRCRRTTDTLARETLVETPATLLTTYRYDDPRWPHDPTGSEIASVSASLQRRESMTYDAATGRVLARTVRGWTGDPPREESRVTTTALHDGVEGAAFVVGGAFDASWQSLRQPRLPKSVDGPRTDAADLTTFVYYPLEGTVPAPWRGRLAAVRNAAGHIERFEDYDAFGNARRVIDANGVVQQRAFDGMGRLLSTTVKGVAGCDTAADPLCTADLTLARTYAGAGPVASEQQPGGGIVAYEYDVRGRIAAVSRGPSAADLRERLETQYDPQTGRKSVERWLSRDGGTWTERKRESYAYDLSELLARVSHPDGTSLQYGYDPAGNLSSARDENHTSPNTRYEYDAAGRLTKLARTASGGDVVTRYAYDRHGNPASVTDPNGNVTRYAYDDFGQMIRQVSPVTGTTRYLYDAAGQLVSTTHDGTSGTTRRVYDILGRVTSATSTWPGRAPETVTWSYDAGSFGKGRLSRTSVTIEEPIGGRNQRQTITTSYSWNRRGLLLSESQSIDNDKYTTAYAYDADGNRSRITYPSGRAVDYTFDFASRPVSAVTGQTTLVSNARYLPFGPLRELAFGNGTTRTMTFDQRYRPLTNRLTGPIPSEQGPPAPGVLASYEYGHDPAGNITRIADLVDPSRSRDFGYDDLHRLTVANAPGLWGAGAYRYDAMGNLLSTNVGENLRTFAMEGTTPKIAATFRDGRREDVTYDAAGNETAAGSRTFTYSARNHLAGAGTRLYTYDSRGVRTTTFYTVTLSAFALERPTASANETLTGTVAVTEAAPAGGLTVRLASSDRSVSVPKKVTIAAGQASAAFPITVGEKAKPGSVTLTATFASTLSATLTIVDTPPLSTFTVTPVDVVGGHPVSAQVTLAAPAPDGGAVVTITSNREAVSGGTIEIRAGSTSGSTTLTTSAVPSPAAATLTATYGGSALQTSVQLRPVSAPDRLLLTPDGVVGGESVIGTVTLAVPAPAGGRTFTLASSNSGAASLPSSVEIPEGAQSGTFAVTTFRVAGATSVTITAADPSSTLQAALTVVCPTAPAPAPSFPAGESVFIDELLPPGAAIGGTITWDATQAASGQFSLSAPYRGSGIYHAAIAGLSEPVAPSEKLFVYARVGDCAVPRQIAVRAKVAGRWVTAYWGEPLPGGIHMGAVPLRGSWVRLDLLLRDRDADGDPVLSDLELLHVDGQVWFDRIGRAADCVTPLAPQPAVPDDEDVLLDDDAPAGVVFENRSNGPLAWSSPQAASGARSLVHPYRGFGTYVTGINNLAAPLVGGAKLSLYALADPCSPPVRQLHLRITTTSGSRTVSWGEPLWDVDSSTIQNGPVPASGSWQRLDIPLAPLGLDSGTLIRIDVAHVDGRVWFDRIAVWPLTRARLTSFVSDHEATVAAGTTVTWTATATGTVYPLQYRFERRNDAGNWSIVQPYGASNMYTWTPAAADVGSNAVRVSVRNAGSLADFEDTATLGVRVYEGEPERLSDEVPVSLSVPFDAIASGAPARRHSLYTPELQLLAETEITTASKPAIQHEYVWFAGQPVAQLTGTNTIHWYFNDHLGTPILQTDATPAPVWRTESDPYGSPIPTLTTPDKHQPLRFPGQENDGSTELSYNVFRWYRAGWGRYTQADPAGLAAGLNLYGYALANPNSLIDPLGAEPKFPQFPGTKTDGCKAEEWKYCEGKCGSKPVVGCYVTITHKLKTVKGFPQFGMQRTVNCNCKEDDCEKSWPDKLKDWWKEFTDPNKPPLPPLIPIPPKLPTPKPVIPGLPPFFINPCMLNPSLCDDGTGIA